MRNKNRKGFLTVLCLCILSVAGIFGAVQYRSGQNWNPNQAVRTEEPEESRREAANSKGAAAQADTEDKNKEQAKIETEDDLLKIGEAELAQAEPSEEDKPEEEADLPEESLETSAGQIQSELLSFSDVGALQWPVDGDVILKYSMDKSIYFSTLNQYKYHPAIVISAKAGSQVQCAARGKVSRINVDEETGTTLSMDLGDGYEAVYGQLKEVAVQEGDYVEAGELIAYVSEPTKYYTLEGSNLYFQLLKDQEPVNPMDYIQ